MVTRSKSRQSRMVLPDRHPLSLWGKRCGCRKVSCLTCSKQRKVVRRTFRSGLLVFRCRATSVRTTAPASEESIVMTNWAKAASLLFVGLCLGGTGPALSEEQKCPESDSGISLPTGFCATIFADKVGHARQLLVAPDGTVYVNTWSGVYFGTDTPPAGGFLIALKDTKGTGHADVNVRFGPTARRYGHSTVQELALCRDRRSHRSLRLEGWRNGPFSQTRDDTQRHAAQRRPPHAPLRHRWARQSSCIDGI